MNIGYLLAQIIRLPRTKILIFITFLRAKVIENSVLDQFKLKSKLSCVTHNSS